MSRPPAALDHLTEQPGPRTHGHGAPPLHGETPNGCLRDHSASHAGDKHDPLISQHERTFPAIHDRPPLVGVKLVRPRRCAAAGAPAGPLPHGDVIGSCEEDPEEQSGQPGDTMQVTGANLHALLTLVAHMGAADRVKCTLPTAARRPMAASHADGAAATNRRSHRKSPCHVPGMGIQALKLRPLRKLVQASPPGPARLGAQVGILQRQNLLGSRRAPSEQGAGQHEPEPLQGVLAVL
jgi:hypothetical protein